MIGRGLLQVLARVDADSWDGLAGQELLVEVRHTVVLPLVVSLGLRGVAAEQAAATGWAVAWEVLRAPSTRAAASPWGVLWVAVRRAIMNEDIAAKYATGSRDAWRLAAAEGPSAARPVSVEALRTAGWEPQDAVRPADSGIVPLVVDLMVEAGWLRDRACEVMEAVAEAAPWGSGSGWRWIAKRVDAEPWQVRRLIDVVRGTCGPSAAHLARNPQDCELRASFVECLRRTVHRDMRPAAKAS